MQQCKKSTYIGTSLTADHSKVRRGATQPHLTPPLWYAACDVSHVPATPIVTVTDVNMQLKERGWGSMVSSLGHWTRRDGIGSNAGYQPGDNAAQNALCSSPGHPFISLQYQVMQTSVTWQWPTSHGGRLPRYRAHRLSVPSSADIICIREKFVAHMLTYCDPHISRPPILRGQNCPKFFDLYTSTYSTSAYSVHVIEHYSLNWLGSRCISSVRKGGVCTLL